MSFDILELDQYELLVLIIPDDLGILSYSEVKYCNHHKGPYHCFYKQYPLNNVCFILQITLL